VNTRGESIPVMHPLFQEGEGGSIPTSPLLMRVERIHWRTAKELNRLWHSRLPRFGTGAVEATCWLSFAAEYQQRAFAVAIWSHPCARNLPQHTWLELRRLAVAPDAPRHTCSWMLGVMVRLIRKQRPEIENLVSYQDLDSHKGTIYAAAGWKPTTVNADGNWTRPGRHRPKAQSE
jgi:hypothetical protein